MTYSPQLSQPCSRGKTSFTFYPRTGTHDDETRIDQRFNPKIVPICRTWIRQFSPDDGTSTCRVLRDRFTGHSQTDNSHLDTADCRPRKCSKTRGGGYVNTFPLANIVYSFLSRHDFLFRIHDTVFTFTFTFTPSHRRCAYAAYLRVASQTETKAPTYTPPV